MISSDCEQGNVTAFQSIIQDRLSDNLPRHIVAHILPACITKMSELMLIMASDDEKALYTVDLVSDDVGCDASGLVYDVIMWYSV